MPTVIGASTGWGIGLVLGVVVVIVAAAIVITIVVLANRIAGQARGAVAGVERVRAQTDALDGCPGSTTPGSDPPCGPVAAQGGGG